MGQLEDLTTKVDGITAQVAQLGTDLVAEIARIKAQFPDISTELGKLDAIAAALQNLDNTATSA